MRVGRLSIVMDTVPCYVDFSEQGQQRPAFRTGTGLAPSQMFLVLTARSVAMAREPSAKRGHWSGSNSNHPPWSCIANLLGD